jgi:exodeoxyribonuclease VII large subunit
MRQRLRDAGDRLSHLAQMLDSLSPLATLGRGYAIVTDGEGRVVTDAGSVAAGDKVNARLASGRLALTVDRVDRED